MAGLIKKQILKHLSKFAKNLSADSIHLSTLKGEGELSNLELDCIAIQNLLDLPTWLQINHAKCNRVHVKIPWTKLKVSPIILFLDCVNMDMVTCEEPRPPNGPSPIEASASSGDNSYGFTEKVLEGITVRINSINVNFKSPVFTAEFQLSQLLVYSTDPEGKKADLRFTRLINSSIGQVLTFKKITWQTMRIVSDAASKRTGGLTTPLRLITNQTTIEIVLRRKISDLSVLASKLHVKFDDLLWVLTDAQVHSALLCVQSVKETIDRSREQRRGQQQNNKQNPSPPPTPDQSDASSESVNDPYFSRHVIHETSYHCDIDRIDLHICDDGSNPSAEATYKKVVEGGAILINLYNLRMDHYPRHNAGKPRNHFRDFNDIATARDKWAEMIINKFRKDFVELKKAADTSQTINTGKASARLLESCLIFRLGDIEIGQVTSSADKELSNQKVLSSNRKELFLPADMPLASVFVTDYYYPDSRDYLAPHNNLFVRVNAPYVRTHWPSLLWLNQLSLSTMRTVQKMLKDLGVVMSEKDPVEEDHLDIRIEALMPKIFVPLVDASKDANVPEGIEIQISQLAVTNCRHGEHSSRKELLRLVKEMQGFYINNNPCFPSDRGHDFDFLHKRFEEHANAGDSPIVRALAEACPSMKRQSLLSKAHEDIWCIWVRQIWVDFVVKSSFGGKSKAPPFLYSVPLTVWICRSKPTPPKPSPRTTCSLPSLPSESGPSSPKTASAHTIVSGEEENSFGSVVENTPERPRRNKMLLDDFYRKPVEDEKVVTLKPLKEVEGAATQYVIIQAEKPINVMLDHHQFLFFLRLADSIESIGNQVQSDTSTILSSQNDEPGVSEGGSSGLRIFLPAVNINLVLRSVSSLNSSSSSSTNPVKPDIMASHVEENNSPHVRPISPTSMFSCSSDDCSADTISVFGDDNSSLLLPPVLAAMGGSAQGKRSLSTAHLSPNSAPADQLRKKAGIKAATKLVSSSPRSHSFETESIGSDAMTSGYHTGSNRTASPCDDSVSCASSGTSSLEQFEVLELDSLHESNQFSKPGRSPSIPSVVESSYEPPNPELVKSRATTDPSVFSSSSASRESEKKVEEQPTLPDADGLKSKLVSVLRISTCGAVELAVDEHDEGASIRIVAPQLALKQFGDSSLDDAINRFEQSTPSISAPPYSTPCMRMRIDSGRCASRFHSGIDRHTDIQIHHFHDKIFSSTLTNLGAFFEDESAPEVVPMKIDAFDVSLSIEDDLELAYPTSVRSPPITLNVHEAHIKRDVNGVFHVSTETNSAPDLLTSLHFSTNQDKASTACDRVSNDSDATKQSRSSDERRFDADESTAEIASLRQRLEEMTRERDALASTLHHLQEEFEKCERERSQLQSLAKH